MSLLHNQMAHACGRSLLASLRANSADWIDTTKFTQHSTYWQGMADWPQPDQAFQDAGSKATLAVEFKPPGHGKTEYVRGLGQAVTYLGGFESALLVLPDRAVDGFRIGKYLADLVQREVAGGLSLGVLTYESDPSTLSTLVTVPRRLSAPPVATGSHRKVFWAYWRDLSQFDLLAILRATDQMQTYDRAFAWYWTKLRAKGKARTWEDNRRSTGSGDAYRKAEAINTRLSLRHCGLLNADGTLTESALALIQIGKVYGPESRAFIERLSRSVLLDGRHLELIFWIDEVQATLPASALAEAGMFYKAIDGELLALGILAAPTSGAGKPSFFRDEPKLWNKLGLLRRASASRYFHPGRGLVFDWRAIISVVGEA